MEFLKCFFVFMNVMVLVGCSSLGGSRRDAYEQGYRQGVGEEIKQVASEFQGGNFPYYHWTSPLVQQVRIPAHISNGVMIPEHDELIIIKPGEWTISPAYPIQTQKRKNYDTQVSHMDGNVSNITALP